MTLVSNVADTAWESSFSDLWWELGAESKTAIVDLLPSHWAFEGKRILDFGSGPGRTLREFLPEAQRAEFWGLDIDERNVQELRSTMSPPIHAMQSSYMPPLGLESSSFDLVWAISVFTHLTENSIPWLLELHRLLKPGGLLIATYMGRWVSEFIAGEPWDDDRVGMNVLRSNSRPEDGAPLVLISDWWLREHWGRAFEVLHVEPRIHNQSWALLRKREVALTPEDVARPADDAREYVALRHNLSQVQREIHFYQQALEVVQRRAAERVEDLRRSYETSSSWRITEPLRKALSTMRAVRAVRATRRSAD